MRRTRSIGIRAESDEAELNSIKLLCGLRGGILRRDRKVGLLLASHPFAQMKQ